MENMMKRQDMERKNAKDEADYQVMYHSLFKDVVDAWKVLKNSEDRHVKEAVRILESVQCKTEEIYIQQGKGM